MINQVNIPAANIKIRPDGIMHVHVKVQTHLEIEDSIAIIEARTKLANNRSYPIMYTATKLVIPTPEARVNIATEKRSKLVKADAFVVNSLPQRLMAKIYRVVNKPVRPTQYFETEESAIEWLKNFVD